MHYVPRQETVDRRFITVRVNFAAASITHTPRHYHVVVPSTVNVNYLPHSVTVIQIVDQTIIIQVIIGATITTHITTIRVHMQQAVGATITTHITTIRVQVQQAALFFLFFLICLYICYSNFFGGDTGREGEGYSFVGDTGREGEGYSFVGDTGCEREGYSFVGDTGRGGGGGEGFTFRGDS